MASFNFMLDSMTSPTIRFEDTSLAGRYSGEPTCSKKDPPVITVAHVLRLHGLGLNPVSTGNMALPVSWVVTSELTDPTPYLNGGEIVLFTGLTSSTVDHAWDDYARRLADKGVVALGMDVGGRLTWDRIPDELIAAAREVGLTLFGVPERMPFLRIIQEVAGLQAAEERVALETTVAHQRALTRAAAAVDGSARSFALSQLSCLKPGQGCALPMPRSENDQPRDPCVAVRLVPYWISRVIPLSSSRATIGVKRPVEAWLCVDCAGVFIDYLF